MKKYQKSGTYQDKTYRLLGSSTPLAYMLPIKNSRRYPLLWFDEEKGVNRALRYSVNQPTPFEDEQDGNAILEPIIFEDGMLTVPRENQVLQEFLYYHPLNGRSFEEVNPAKEAEEEVQIYEVEMEAMLKAKKLSIQQLEMISRVFFGADPSRMTTNELKRDLYVHVKRNPRGFLAALDDPDMEIDAKVRSIFDKGLLSFRNNNKEIWLNSPTSKRKLSAIPFGKDPVELMIAYFKTEEGIEVLKHVESVMD